MASSSAYQQISSIPNSDLRRLFTVIARPRNNMDNQFSAQRTAEELAHQLSANGVACSITISGPNYIINPGNPELQTMILSWSPLETTNNAFDFAAWSREDENAQIPWIIGNVEGYSCIEIDALTILPHTMNQGKKHGCSKLKDSFAKMLDPYYDLKAPDFSYLMINEIKEYYVAKHAIIILCKQIIIDMVSSMQELLPSLQTADYHIKEVATKLPTREASQKDTTLCHYIGQATAAIIMATQFITQLGSLTESLSELDDVPIKLQNYKEIPPLSEIPVPPAYVTRLQAIHKIATKHVYGAEAIIGSIKSGDGGFQAYIKIGSHIHKYHSVPMKTPATAETAAVYESLKYMTNVLGFKFLDYNYPTLQLIVSAIRANNASINIMQSSVNTIVANSQNICEAFSHLPPNTPASYLHTTHLVQKSMFQLISAINDHHATITTSFHRFMAYKEQFLTTFLNTHSPIATPSQWIQLDESEIQ